MGSKSYDRRINLYINGKEVKNDIASIKKAMYKLTNEQARMTRGSAEYNKKTAEIRKLKKILADHNESLRVTGGAWSKIKKLAPAGMIAGIGYKVIQLSKDLYNLSKTMEADNRRSSIVFGESLEYVQERAEELSKQMGVTNHEFVAMATSTADLLIPLDFTREQAAEMSVELQKLTGALDEWTGGTVGAKEVSNILTKAMLGENEQLKQLGIAIRKDTDEYRDLVKLKIETTGVTKLQAEAMATLELIQKKSADAQTAYTQEGDKLLRTEKQLARWFRQKKENLVEYFDEKPEEKLKKEGQRVNELTIQLYNANLEEEKRAEILNELRILAPQIVATLTQEGIATQATTKALQEYNNEMRTRIILSQQDKELNKIGTKLAKAEINLEEAENRARAILVNMSTADYLESWQRDKVVEILDSGKSMIEMLSDLKDANIALAGGVDDPTFLIKKFNRKVNKFEETFKAKLEQRNRLAEKYGLNDDDGGDVSSEVASEFKNETKEIVRNFQEALAEIETDTAGIDLTEYFTELSDQRLAVLDDTLKQGIDLEKLAMEETARLQQEHDAETAAKRLQNFEMGADLAMSLTDTVGMFNEARMNRELAAAGDNEKKKDAIRKKYAKKNQGIAAVQAAIQGALGIVKTGAELGYPMAIPFQIAQGIQTLAQIALIKSQKFFTGGYTKSGDKYQPAGIVHAGEWVANADMVASPVTGPIIQALESYRTGAVPGMATGGPAGSTEVNVAAQSPIIARDPQLVGVLTGMAGLLRDLDRRGVRMHFTYKDARDVRDGIDTINKNEEDSTM